MENTQKFSGKSEHYEQSRPAYAAEFITWLADTLELDANTPVADFGAGTGKLTRQLLELGLPVYAVEPNPDMREKMIALLNGYANFHPIAAPAENSGLAEKSVKLITAASAFHWFDTHAFRAECQRILWQDGWVCLVWNRRQLDNQINQGFRDIFSRYCPNFSGFSFEQQKTTQAINNFFKDAPLVKHFDNPVRYDLSGFVGRALSASYALVASDVGYAEFVGELEALFHQHAIDGFILMPHQSVAYLGKV